MRLNQKNMGNGITTNRALHGCQNPYSQAHTLRGTFGESRLSAFAAFRAGSRFLFFMRAQDCRILHQRQVALLRGSLCPHSFETTIKAEALPSSAARIGGATDFAAEDDFWTYFELCGPQLPTYKTMFTCRYNASGVASSAARAFSATGQAAEDDLFCKLRLAPQTPLLPKIIIPVNCDPSGSREP